MKYKYLMLLCSFHFSCDAELSQLEDMEAYSVSMEGKELDVIIPVSSIDTAQVYGVDKLGANGAIVNIAPTVNPSNVTVRDTGHSFVVQPIKLQIESAGF